MKYVIFKGNGCLHPVLFSDHTTHAQVKVDGAVPISAGFVKFTPSMHFPECYGRAESLKLESRGEEDADIIRKWQIDCGMTSFMFFDD